MKNNLNREETKRETRELFIERRTTTDPIRLQEIDNRIVELNITMLHAYMNKRFSRSMIHHICTTHKMTEDDLYAIGLEGFAQVIRKYDYEKSQFSTYAYLVIGGYFNKFFDVKRNKMLRKTDSLSQEIYQDGGGGDSITLEEALPSDFDMSSVDADLDIRAIINRLGELYSKRDMEIWKKYVFHNKTQADISEGYNISQVQVSRILMRMQECARNLREDINYIPPSRKPRKPKTQRKKHKAVKITDSHIKEIKKTFSEEEVSVFLDYVGSPGTSQTEIARRHSIPQPRVSNIFTKIKNHLKLY